jgi:nitrogen fixation protein NifU and related proteins
VYSPQLLDHFEHPRNAGFLDSPDVVAQLENPVCGDVLALSARIADGRIVEIRFKAKGCVPAMACGSVLTTLASGRTLEEAAEIDADAIIAVLGGFPQASSHAAHLAINALALLLKNARLCNL